MKQFFSKEAEIFIKGAVDDAIEARLKNGNVRNDLIDTIIALRKESAENGNFVFKDEDLLYAQAAVFFSAGFETSSTILGFGMFEIAKNVSEKENYILIIIN